MNFLTGRGANIIVSLDNPNFTQILIFSCPSSFFFSSNAIKCNEGADKNSTHHIHLFLHNLSAEGYHNALSYSRGKTLWH